MARPKPVILLENVDKAYNALQILEADDLWAVVYNKKPISIRSLNKITSSPAPKYKKSCFPSRGSAINLAARLNEQFKTTLFEVVRLTALHE